MLVIRIINGLLLIVILVWSLKIVTIASIKYYKTQKPGYAPLINKTSTLPTSNTYGTTTNDSFDDDISVDTITMDVEIKSSRWTVFNLSRFLFSLIQLSLFIVATRKISSKEYGFSNNEGSKSDVLVAYVTHIAFWVSDINMIAGLILNICNLAIFIDFVYCKYPFI